MNSIDCTIIGDGTSDAMTIPVIKWCLDQHFPHIGFNIELARLGSSAKGLNFSEKVCRAIELYPCTILFIHRDVENTTIKDRQDELDKKLESVNCTLPKVIFVIPKRMSEAWLLIEEKAIRYAANNPNGRMPLKLPDLNQLEKLPDPKSRIIQLLEEATGLNKRRRRSFKPRAAIHRLSENIEDYSVLRKLESFDYLEQQVSLLDFDELTMSSTKET